MSKFNLRPYQQKMVTDMLEYRTSNCVGVTATGSGKSVIMASLAEKLLEQQPGLSIVVTVHVKEILEQLKVPFGDLPVEFISVQKLTRSTKKYDIVIFDECQHAMAGSYRKIIAENVNQAHFGFTALPLRGLIPDMSPQVANKDTWKFSLTGLKSDKCFDNFVIGLSTKECIDQGYLTPFEIISGRDFHIEQVNKRVHDFNEQEVNDALTVKECHDYIVETIGSDKTIVFSHSINYGSKLAKMLQDSGITAQFVSSKSKKKERAQYVKDFKEHRTQVLIGVNIFIEGFDVPACDSMYMFRPTRSVSVWFQSIGRVLRLAEGKTIAKVHDYVGNHKRLGVIPTDIDLNDTLLVGTLAKQTCEVCQAYGAAESENPTTIGTQTSADGQRLKKAIRENFDLIEFFPCGKQKAKLRLKPHAMQSLDLDEFFDLTGALSWQVEVPYFRIPVYKNKYGQWSASITKDIGGNISQSFSMCLVIPGVCKFGSETPEHFQQVILKNYENGIKKVRAAKVI
ncbi:putative helicase [Lactococcus phage phiQ1]|uniref:Putative helicase n=1 Tax=Lactococcus phage phiQ1 TaxID=2488571 RepID=A0A455VPN3_9CAUD|nr:putative helicase [Lactococcus phage phiQ1]BBI90387.1 putative helicase [Lactococcus phage phiQ1]